MAYLGNAPARSFISFERQVFTIVNSQTAYTLSHSVTNENDIRLVINNIVQEPGSGKAYTASGTTLTLSAALTNGTDEMYCVFLGRAVATNAPGAGSVNTAAIAADAVTEAKIADDAVESEHLNNNVISGQTELASEPADTDEFLVSDAGTLKRIDYSLIKPSTPHMVKLSTQTASGDSSIDFTSGIDSTYQQYHFEFTEINLATDGAEFQFQADTGTNTNYNLTITSIVYHAENSEGGGGGSLTYSTARDQSQGTAFQDLFPDAGNGTDESAFGYLRVQNPSSSTYTKNFMSRMDGYHQNNLAFNMVVGGYFNTTTPITRFRFKSSSGNFDGRITMYGVNA
jgi:hypothetical protein